MATATNRSMRDAFSTLLRDELALTPDRWRAIARIAIATTIVVAIAMTFQIPLPPYIAYLVFLVSQADAASTLMTAVGGLIAASLAVAVSILFYVFDASEPAVRLPLLALSAFAGTFLSRTSKLGPIAFLAGYVLVLSQTLLDDIPATDPLIHLLLWLWVIVALPVGVTVIVNLLFGESPVALSRKRATQLLERLACSIENPYSEHPEKLRDELLALGELKNKAFLWDKRLKAYAEEDAQLIALLLEIQSIARLLPIGLPADVRRSFGTSIREAGQLFLQRRSGSPANLGMARVPVIPTDHSSCTALQLALQELLDRASSHHTDTVAPTPKVSHPFLVPDAFQNRAHARFAIKVMFAVLASYATYTLLDWPGIRTAVTTCFFVSLTTFGESIHKFTLRVSGAIIGGLLAGLCIVFVLPLLTDIGELCLLIALVSAFCAWISTSSENISYAGMQIAFAFFLGVLQGYGPASDLTVLRDRVVGILIGNVWVTLIFVSLWPASAVDQARSLRATALKKLGQLLNAGATSSALDKMTVSEDLSHADLLQARATFEWRSLSPSLNKIPGLNKVPDARMVERITALAFALIRLRDSQDTTSSASTIDDRMAEQLIALSESKEPSPIVIEPDIAAPTSLWQARQKLEEEIGHARRAI